MTADQRATAEAQVARLERLITSIRHYGQGSNEWAQANEQLDIYLRDIVGDVMAALRERAGLPPRTEPFPEQSMVTAKAKSAYDPTPVAELADRQSRAEQRVLERAGPAPEREAGT